MCILNFGSCVNHRSTAWLNTFGAIPAFTEPILGTFLVKMMGTGQILYDIFIRVNLVAKRANSWIDFGSSRNFSHLITRIDSGYPGRVTSQANGFENVVRSAVRQIWETFVSITLICFQRFRDFSANSRVPFAAFHPIKNFHIGLGIEFLDGPILARPFE